MDKLNFKIPYGKNVYDKRNKCCNKSFKKRTQMGKCVSEFEKKLVSYLVKSMV